MRIASTQSAHWTDEQLIDHLYGVGPEDGHLGNCAYCRARFAAVERKRQDSIANFAEADPVGSDFLAAQRRAIYARLSQPSRWWQASSLKRFAAVGAMLSMFAAGTVTLYENHQRELAESRSDAQLAQEVSQMSGELEPSATAPLKGLFVE